jgi:hypothetical protein
MLLLRYPAFDTEKMRKDGKPYAKKRIEKGYIKVVHYDCPQRRCFTPMLNKGAFIQGRGYASYYDKPEWVCQQQHLFGCPSEDSANESLL